MCEKGGWEREREKKTPQNNVFMTKTNWIYQPTSQQIHMTTNFFAERPSGHLNQPSGKVADFKPSGTEFASRLGPKRARRLPVPPAAVDPFLRCFISYLQMYWYIPSWINLLKK